MRVGVDFDNTVVCYGDLFRRTAVERGVVPPDLGPAKDSVRDHLRASGREDEWTRIQGHVYGVLIHEVAPFPGALEFFRTCRERGIEASIVSLKTARPVLGEPHDLRRAAHEWLERHGFYDLEGGGLTPERVHFEPTGPAKLERISEIGCGAFVDDLPEFLARPEFPPGVRRILFDPEDRFPEEHPFPRARSWPEVERWVLEPC